MKRISHAEGKKAGASSPGQQPVQAGVKGDAMGQVVFWLNAGRGCAVYAIIL